MDRWLAIALGMIGLLSAGCGSPAAPAPASSSGRLALAELPGARASPNQQLQAELALVRQDKGLPLQLAPADAAEGSSGSRATAAELLNQAFPPISRRLVATPLAEIYAGGPLALSPVQLERGRDLERSHAAAIQQFHRAIPNQPGGFRPRLCDGVLADTSFLDPLTIGCRLEAVAAAIALADDSPAEALPHLEILLRIARVLAAEPNVTTRVAAANLRGDALQVLAAVASHPQATRETHEQLLAMLTEQTADWPSDRVAWVGDRSAGLLVYELVRSGQYLSLLSSEEVQELQQRQTLRVTAQAVMRNIDQDETSYLRMMRPMIDACSQPYFERQGVLTGLRRELVRKEQASDYPLVAGKLLLADFESGHRAQAADFARCQAWLLALGTAVGRESSAPSMNPLTGQPYRIERTPLAVTVAGVLPEHDQPCVVPLPAPREARLPAP